MPTDTTRMTSAAGPLPAQLFSDSSRNRSAPWCSMATFGSRMKGRAYRRWRAVTGRRTTDSREVLATAS